MASDPSPRFALTASVVGAGLAARAFPAAVIEVGRATGPLWQAAFGRLSYQADAPDTTVETIFDLASLTKVIATTSLLMQHAAAERLDLLAPLGERWPAWRDGPRGSINACHLLDHSSGLPAHARLWETCRGREDYAAAIALTPLDRAVGASSVYSDLGFILLGFLLEDLGGPLDAQLSAMGFGNGNLGFVPAAESSSSIAPTEFDVWRNRLLVGEVHDENAAALAGVAGHAGLFGAARDVGTFASLVLNTFHRATVLGPPELMRAFAARSTVPGSSRALGWDTMLPTSSCGTRLSPSAIGHTGFTGTSLWIDPEQDLYVVFLTNRVHPTRANEGLVALRPKVHDAVVEDLR